MDAPYIPLYIDNFDALSELSDRDLGKLIRALFAYINGNEIPELTNASKVAFLLLTAGIDRHNKRQKSNSENGKKGGAPKGNSNAVKSKIKRSQAKTTQKQAKTKQEEKEEEEEKEKEEYTGDKPPTTPLDDAIEKFKHHRKGIKKPMTENAVSLLRAELTKLAGDDMAKKIEIINQSILNGWQGVFELKASDKPQNKKKTFAELAAEMESKL